MVEQRRIVDRDYSVEFVIGSVNIMEDKLVLMACQEIHEELYQDNFYEEMIP